MSCKKDVNLLNENSSEKTNLELVGEVILHNSYDGSLTAEEVSKLWREDLKSFHKNNVSLKSTTSSFQYEIMTRTGTGTDSNTDEKVMCATLFETGTYRGRITCKLDNPGNDRERGNWDVYAINSANYGNITNFDWLELTQIHLHMFGNDGWFVTDFRATVYGSLQNPIASGTSRIVTTPNVWLDNNSSIASVSNTFVSEYYEVGRAAYSSGRVVW